MPEKYKKYRCWFKNFLKTGEATIINKTMEITALNKKNIEFDIELTVSPATVLGKYIHCFYHRYLIKQKTRKMKK
jgi:hypothetical protein